MADAAPKTQIKPPYDHHHENPSKFFLYKAALVTVCLVLVPLFPSLAPDFFSQTLHARSWELLQLIIVGIAVSYGLFSKKNVEEPQKESSKTDQNAQSYVSKLLQVSSVFDDESESHTVIEETSKFQALNSQYYRGEPVVVVAKEDPDIEEQNGVVSKISQKPKPLQLPVRSLRQRVPSPNSRDLGLAVGKPEQKEQEEEKAVLRSPIPWRSRSGRMEMKEINNSEETVPSPSISKEERELNRSFRAPKIFAPPPPAPPPPPSPAFLRKSVLMKSNSTLAATGETRKAVLARSARSVPSEEPSESGGGSDNDDDGLVKSIRKLRADDRVRVADEEMNRFFDKRGASSGSSTTQKENVLIHNATDEDEEDEESDEFDEERLAPSSRNVDVDKKADEFIAKFREQIRLQRIESIRRSTAQRAGKNFR